MEEGSTAALPRAFFARATALVARALVGCRLVVDGGTPEMAVATLVEVEAYLGQGEDEASHAHRGPTRRSAVMFGPPGHLYVYLSYGIHHCVNLVTERDGHGGAVLLRAAEVSAGEPVIRSRRPGTGLAAARLLSGPGNLCRGLGITLQADGADLCRTGRFALLPALALPPLVAASRIGITRGQDAPLRFSWRDHPSLSRGR